MFDDMTPALQKKLQTAVRAAGAIAVARGMSVEDAFRFVGETLLDHPDPEIQDYLTWLDRQHRRDLH
jgi:hypothetical protein